jgi:hypothetical protein
MLDDFDEEAPRYRKKSKKHHVKSDHRHDYEEVCIDAGSSVIMPDGRHTSYHMGVRCKVCGRLSNVKMWRYEDEPPQDMRLFEVEDFYELLSMKYLPDGMEVTRG